MLLTTAKSTALAARIRELVEGGLARKGVSARRASIDVVGHDGLIRDIRAGRVPSFDRVVSLFAYLSIPLEFGPQAPPTGVAEPGAASSGFDRSEALRAGFLPLPWHPASRSLGTGPVAFRAAEFERRGFDAESLSLVMPDRFLAGAEGALALVDRSAERGGGPAPWCFVDEGVGTLALLHWQDRTTLIVSGDRPGTVPRALSGAAREQLQLLGRVIWSGVWTDAR